MDGLPTGPSSGNGASDGAFDEDADPSYVLWALERRRLPMLAHCLDCHHSRLDHPGGGLCDPPGERCDCGRFAAPISEGEDSSAEATEVAQADDQESPSGHRRLRAPSR